MTHNFEFVLFALLGLVTFFLGCCLAMLERIEKHLRAEHVRALGPLHDRTPEAMAERRSDLGLDDGYPYKHQRVFLLVAVVALATYFYVR